MSTEVGNYTAKHFKYQWDKHLQHWDNLGLKDIYTEIVEWEHWDLVFEKIQNWLLIPFADAIIQIILIYTVNLVFAHLGHKRSSWLFNLLAFIAGILQFWIISSLNLIPFALITAVIFTFFYFYALLLTTLIPLELHTFLKILVAIYAMFCFQIYEVTKDLDDFITVVAVMGLKLFCIRKTPENPDTEPKFFTILAFLTYSPWITYMSFITLRRKTYKKTEAWHTRVVVAVPKAIILRMVAYNLIQHSYMKDAYMGTVIYALFKTFQFRCRYYYKGQIAELALLAAGVRRYDWTCHYIYEMALAETSIKATNMLRFINIPLTEFIYYHFILHPASNDSILLHIFLGLLIICANSVPYCLVIMLFIASFYFQERALLAAELYLEVCFYTCGGLLCDHEVHPTTLLKLLYLFANHFSVTILFLERDTALTSALMMLMVIGFYILNILFFSVTLRLYLMRLRMRGTRGAMRRHYD